MKYSSSPGADPLQRRTSVLPSPPLRSGKEPLSEQQMPSAPCQPPSLPAPSATHLNPLCRLGCPSPPEPSPPRPQPGFQWLAGDLGGGIRESHSPRGVQRGPGWGGRGEGGRDRCVGWQRTAMAPKTLIHSSGHRAWATLTCI